MPQLFIANATRQRFAFMFNPPDADDGQNRRGRGPITQYIYAGQQERISGDWTRAQIDAIVDQHRPYGLVHVSEIDRAKGFTGQCYSIDKPVDAELIEELMGRNINALDQRGRKMREMAAVAVNNGIETDIRERGLDTGVSKLEVEVTEVRTSRSDTDETAPQRIRVARGDGEGEPAPRGRSRRAA